MGSDEFVFELRTRNVGTCVKRDGHEKKKAGRMKTYDMVEWKANAFYILMGPIQEAPYCEFIRLIDVLWASDHMERRADNNDGIDDSQIERGLVVGKELPRSFFGELL